MKNLRDSYRYYTKHAEEGDALLEVKEYVLICNLFMKFIISLVMEGHRVGLPHTTGSISIIGKKQKVRFDGEGNIKGLAPDWVKTKKLWDSNAAAKEKKQLVYHLNEHSDGVRYRYFWRKRGHYFKNTKLYSLRMTRENKRKVTAHIKQGKDFTTFNVQ